MAASNVEAYRRPTAKGQSKGQRDKRNAGEEVHMYTAVVLHSAKLSKSRRKCHVVGVPLPQKSLLHPSPGWHGSLLKRMCPLHKKLTSTLSEDHEKQGD